MRFLKLPHPGTPMCRSHDRSGALLVIHTIPTYLRRSRETGYWPLLTLSGPFRILQWSLLGSIGTSQLLPRCTSDARGCQWRNQTNIVATLHNVWNSLRQPINRQNRQTRPCYCKWRKYGRALLTKMPLATPPIRNEI